MLMTDDKYDPLERLTLLSPNAIDWKHIPSGYHKLTPADIAAKLAHVDRGASLLGRVKIAGQTELMPDLIRALRTAVVEAYIPWPTKKKTLLPKMAEMALFEVVDPRICRTCKGAGTIPETDKDGRLTGKPKCCEDCAGGRYAWTEKSRYEFCGLHHESWKKLYNRPYMEILYIVWEWHEQVRDALSNASTIRSMG